MKRIVVYSSLLVCSFLIAFLGSATAATLNLPAIDRGFFSTTGGSAPYYAGYVVGDSRPGGSSDFSAADFRNFFVFDLASVALPIESADLALYMPAIPLFFGGLYFNGYDSDDPSETYELHDVFTPIDTLINATGGPAMHTDLGDGAIYGSRVIAPADNGTIVQMKLSPVAIANMNNTHGYFAIGGKLTTLDDFPNTELLFMFTDTGDPLTELRLTLVPELSSLAVISIAAVLLSGSRLRKWRD